MATTDATIASRSPQAVAITRISTRYAKPAVVALTGIKREHTKVVAAIRARAMATREKTGTATPKKRLESRPNFGLAAAIIGLAYPTTLHRLPPDSLLPSAALGRNQTDSLCGLRASKASTLRSRRCSVRSVLKF